MAEYGGSRSRWRLLGRRSEESEKTFKGDRYSFSYPGEWKEAPFHLGVEEGSAASYVALGPGGPDDGLLLGVYELDFPITESNIDRYSDETAENVKQDFRKGLISEGPTLATVAGRPAFWLELSHERPNGEPLQSRMIFVFAGRTEYFLNFQSTPQSADEMKRGCERVVNTFRIE